MMGFLYDFALTAMVMAFWVGVAFVIAFVGRFLIDLVGERVYGRPPYNRFGGKR